jgi:hypothetical protein
MLNSDNFVTIYYHFYMISVAFRTTIPNKAQSSVIPKIQIYDDANLIIENCRFINSELDAHNCTIFVKNSSFSRSVNGTNAGEGGAISLYKVMGILDNCTFINSSAFHNDTWVGGSGGGLYIDKSIVTLIDPIIMGNIASTGGGICVADSNLTIHDGRIMYNRALPINYTNPVSYFGGVGGAISAVRSKITLDNTIISGNRARVAAAINSTKDSEIRLVGNVVMSDNREI